MDMQRRYIALLGILLFFQAISVGHAQEFNRVITTGVPFLMITPDARAAGMGDQGVATPADAFAQQWNPAKHVFLSKEAGVGISYTPYLSKLVNDIFLGNLNYFKKLNERSAWAASLKYFSLGDIQFNELIGGSIVDQGTERPNELTLDLSYALKLSETFSMAVAGRFIRSDLKINSNTDTRSANSLGVDLSGYFQSNPFKLSENTAVFRSGFNISNVGPRLKYDVGGVKNYIPTNLKLGMGLELFYSSNNRLGVYTEFNKLLVPGPVATYDENNNFTGYTQPDINFLKGISTSFSDAPDGFKEELKEITWALGLEYVLQESFALRTGYFNESPEKGSRRYITFGAGFVLPQMDIDISYLFSTSRVRSPLENTLRFSVNFKWGNPSP